MMKFNDTNLLVFIVSYICLMTLTTCVYCWLHVFNDTNLLVFIVSYMYLMILTYLCLINLIKLNLLIHKSISAILSEVVNAV